jgi:O-antigen/teichoic acid export membrane protein
MSTQRGAAGGTCLAAASPDPTRSFDSYDGETLVSVLGWPEPERWESALSDARSADDLTQATARGLRWISLSRIATEVILMASMIGLARLVKPAAFGQFAVAVIIQEIAVGIPAEGVGSALVQRHTVNREHLQAGAAVTLIIGVVLGLLTLVLSSVLIEPVFGAPTAALVRLSTPLFLFAAFSTVPVALLRRRLDFRRLSALETVGSATRAVVAVALAAFAGLQGASLVCGGLAAGVIGTALAWFWATPPPPRLRRSAVRDISGYGLPASMAAICWAGFRNGDYAVLNAKLGAAAAGQYWRAYTLAVEYQRKITVVMFTVAFPVLSRSANHEDLFALRRRMVRVLTVVLFPMLTALAILAPTLIPWLFGADWQPAVVPTQILCFAGAVSLVIDSAGSAMMAAGRARALLGYGVAHFAVYIGSVIVVAPLGLTAVAIDAAVVHTAFLVVAYVVMFHGPAERPLVGLAGDVSAATASSVAMAVIMVPLSLGAAQAGVPPIVHLLAVGGLGSLVYLMVLRSAFRQSWSDLVALVRRLLPDDWDRLSPRRRRKVNAALADEAA